MSRNIDSVMARDHGMAQLMENHRRKNQHDENQTVHAPDTYNGAASKVDDKQQEQKGNMYLERYPQDGTDLKRPFHGFCLLESNSLSGRSNQVNVLFALQRSQKYIISPPFAA